MMVQDGLELQARMIDAVTDEGSALLIVSLAA